MLCQEGASPQAPCIASGEPGHPPVVCSLSCNSVPHVQALQQSCILLQQAVGDGLVSETCGCVGGPRGEQLYEESLFTCLQDGLGVGELLILCRHEVLLMLGHDNVVKVLRPQVQVYKPLVKPAVAERS